MWFIFFVIVSLNTERFGFATVATINEQSNPEDPKDPEGRFEERLLANLLFEVYNEGSAIEEKKKLQDWLQEKRLTTDRLLAKTICPKEMEFLENPHWHPPFLEREKLVNDFKWFIALANTEYVCKFIEYFSDELEDSAIIGALFGAIERSYSYSEWPSPLLVRRTMEEWRQILKKMMESFSQKQWFAGRASAASHSVFSFPAHDPTWFALLCAKKVYQDANKDGYYARKPRWIAELNMSSQDFFHELEKLADEVLSFIFEQYPYPELYLARDITLDDRYHLPRACSYFLEYAYQELKKRFPSATEMHESWEVKLEHIVGGLQVSMFGLNERFAWYGVPPRYWLKKISSPWALGLGNRSYFDMMKKLRIRMSFVNKEDELGYTFVRKQYNEIARPFFLSCEQEFRQHLETEIGKAQLQEHHVTAEEACEVMFAFAQDCEK
jgi:hypothetical protein